MATDIPVSSQMSGGILKSALGVSSYGPSNSSPNPAPDSPCRDSACIKRSLANISCSRQYDGYGQLEWISKDKPYCSECIVLPWNLFSSEYHQLTKGFFARCADDYASSRKMVVNTFVEMISKQADEESSESFSVPSLSRSASQDFLMSS